MPYKDNSAFRKLLKPFAKWFLTWSMTHHPEITKSAIRWVVRKGSLQSAGNDRIGSRQISESLKDPRNKLLLQSSIEAARFPSSWISICLDGLATEDEVLSALEILFQKRSPVLRDVYTSASGISSAAVRCWVRLKEIEWAYASPSASELHELEQVVYNYSGNKQVRRRLENSLLSVLLQIGTRSQIFGFFERSETPPERLFINRQIALLHRLSSFPDADEDLVQLRRGFEQAATPFHKLKLTNMDALAGRARAGWRRNSMNLPARSTSGSDPGWSISTSEMSQCRQITLKTR
jgi:hypothetical protein